MKRSSMGSATLPVESQSAESLYSFSTATSTSTFAGPGSLAGKAIHNFGKLTLKGVQQIIISRRFSSIATHFPHRNTDSFAGFPEMYSDLLELSRIHMYPDSTRIRALQLIMGQIARRSTAYLIGALKVWPEVEVNLLLSEILACLDPIRFLIILRYQVSVATKVFSPQRTSHSSAEDALISAYRQNLPNWEDHSMAPIVDFLRLFASSGEEKWSTAINCGSLDLLLHLYISDFQNPVAFNTRTRTFQKSSVIATCNSFLVEALSDEYAYQMIQSHAIRGLWPLWPMLAFQNFASDRDRSSLRRQIWLSLEQRLIQWRISSIFDALVMDWIKPRNKRMMHMKFVDHIIWDMQVDLLEFSGSSTLNEDTCFRALRSLHRLWSSIHSDEIRAGLEMYIEQTPPDHARETFIRIVRRLILLSCRAPESDTFFMLCPNNCPSSESCPLDLDAVVHFIHRLMTRVSRYYETLHHWLIDGDIVRLLDLTATRLLSSGSLNWNDDTADRSAQARAVGFYVIADPHYPFYNPRGPRYRALVLLLAWRVFQDDLNAPKSQTASTIHFFSQGPELSWDELRFIRFPSYHHDDWAETQLPASVFQTMEQTHRDRVYSWIES
ncbi:hypothetical protein BT96DRAFT_1000305 [Gymnopus androsaceus JB14]|uniref:Uncharacterized protein n=1 Tax=Gymnopus androsaceus JB14 TaxID=1447944 RepID=A0A6A4H568_9AGAR|nr:hypothetical protein BT96DRAFT_1000305 [Gymnopus androsaceus JB14]